METFWEIFTLLTGILYIILEIRQHNFMWVVGVLTALAAMVVFWGQHLYGSFILNGYYLVVSFIGLWQWRKDSAAVGESEIHLRPITWTVGLVSLAAAVAGVFGFGYLARLLGDPMSWLDVSVAVLSAVATWWLTRSYKEQWLLWIVADGLSTWLCFSQNLYWMAGLYLAYTISAVYGYFRWKNRGHSIL